MDTRSYSTQEATILEEINLKDGQVAQLTRRNPYGYLYLELVEGNMPDKYNGAYTTVEFAKQALDHYIEERRIAKTELLKEVKETECHAKKATPSKTTSSRDTLLKL